MQKFKVYKEETLMTLPNCTVHVLEERPNGKFRYGDKPVCKREELDDGAYVPYGLCGKEIMVIPCPDGIHLVLDYDACGDVFSKNDYGSFEFTKAPVKNEDGSTSLSIMAYGLIKYDIEDLLACEADREETMSDFVRRFGGRIESNFRAFANEAIEHGCDPADFVREEK